MPVCIFRGRIIQSPLAGHLVLAFKPMSQTAILLFILQWKQLEHPSSGETETGKSHTPFGLVARSGCRTAGRPIFLPVPLGEKHLPSQWR